MKIAIYGQFYHSNTQSSIDTLLDIFIEKKLEVSLEKDFSKMVKHKNLGDFKTFTELDNSYALQIKDHILNIQHNLSEDKHGWRFKV